MSIDNQIFELIRSRDPEDRKKGVKALARTEDREALRYLATIYKEDRDPEVRDLALKAGQHIKKRTELAAWGEDLGANAGKLADVEIKRDGPKKKPSLPSNAKTNEAKALMDKAMDLLMVSDYAQAQDLAYQAFEIAPNLGEDTYYLSLAGEVMGMPPEDAIVALQEGRPDYEVGGKRGKSKKKRGSNSDETTWTRFFIDSGVYFAVMTVSVAIMAMMLFSSLVQWIDLGLLNEFNAMFYQEYGIPDAIPASFGSDLSQASLGISLGMAFAAGLAYLIGTWLQYAVIHFASSSILGGVGSFRTLFKKVLLPNLILIIVDTIIISIMIYLFSASMTEAFNNPNASSSANFGIIDTLSSISTFVSLVFLVWITFIIGQNYDFGFMKGCGAIIMSSVLMVVGMCSCLWIFNTLASF